MVADRSLIYAEREDAWGRVPRFGATGHVLQTCRRLHGKVVIMASTAERRGTLRDWVERGQGGVCVDDTPDWLLPLISAVRDAQPDQLSTNDPPARQIADRQAAVLILLGRAEADGAEVVLTQRAAGLRDHPGEISFPGGSWEPDDTSPVETALREAAEETGVDPATVRILGELTPVHVIVSGFTLHPVVGVTDRRPDFMPAPGEVDQIIEVSLDHLRDASRIRQGTRIREGVAVEYPYFDLLGHQVWGATAMILGEFICLLAEIEDSHEGKR